MLRPAYPIATERLLLRPFAPDDLDGLVAIHSDPGVVRYPYFDVRSRDELPGVLKQKAGRVALEREGDSINLAAVLADGGELVGDVTLFWRSVQHRQGEVGYILNPAQRSRLRHGGDARAAAPGFEELGLHRITGRLDARKHGVGARARAVVMRRGGAPARERARQGVVADELVYAMLDREWGETRP